MNAARIDTTGATGTNGKRLFGTQKAFGTAFL